MLIRLTAFLLWCGSVCISDYARHYSIVKIDDDNLFTANFRSMQYIERILLSVPLKCRVLLDDGVLYSLGTLSDSARGVGSSGEQFGSWYGATGWALLQHMQMGREPWWGTISHEYYGQCWYDNIGHGVEFLSWWIEYSTFADYFIVGSNSALHSTCFMEITR